MIVFIAPYKQGALFFAFGADVATSPVRDLPCCARNYFARSYVLPRR